MPELLPFGLFNRSQPAVGNENEIFALVSYDNKMTIPVMPCVRNYYLTENNLIPRNAFLQGGNVILSHTAPGRCFTFGGQNVLFGEFTEFFGFFCVSTPFLSISRNLNIVAHYSGFVNTSGPFSEIKIVFS